MALSESIEMMEAGEEEEELEESCFVVPRLSRCARRLDCCSDISFLPPPRPKGVLIRFWLFPPKYPESFPATDRECLSSTESLFFLLGEPSAAEKRTEEERESGGECREEDDEEEKREAVSAAACCCCCCCFWKM